jgi:HlyD family secretion protein
MRKKHTHTFSHRALGAQGLAVLGLVGLIAAACTSEPQSEPASAKRQSGPAPLQVRAINAQIAELEVEERFTGEVVALRSVSVCPLEAGVLEVLNVGAEQQVPEGAVLGRLDAVAAERAVAEAKAAESLGQARLELARTTVQVRDAEVRRRRPLVEQRAFPAAELATLEDAVRTAKAEVEVAQRALAELRARTESAQEALRRRELRAPFSGVVVDHPAPVGTPLNPSTPLLALLDTSSVRFVARISEQHLPRLQQGQRAVVALPAMGTASLAARIERIGATVRAPARTLEVELLFDPQPPGLKVGMFGEVTLELQNERSLPVVPLAAIGKRKDGTRVVWDVSTGVAKGITVEVALELSDRAAVRGLPEGTQVATTGVEALTEGAVVSVAAPRAPGGKAQ